MAQWITWMAQWPWVTEASHRVNKRISPLARETSRIETEPDHSSDVITSGFPFPWTKPRRGSRGAGLLVRSMDKQLEEAENADDETADRNSALRPPVPELGHHPTLLGRAPGTRMPGMQRPLWLILFVSSGPRTMPNQILWQIWNC